MRRFSVLVTAATADLFGFNDAPSEAAVTQPIVNATILNNSAVDSANALIGAQTASAIAAPAVAPATPSGSLANNATSPAAQLVLSNAAPAPATGSQVAIASTSPANPIPDSAAGGIGSYLNQIAAELSANADTTDSTLISNATGGLLPVANAAADADAAQPEPVSMSTLTLGGVSQDATLNPSLPGGGTLAPIPGWSTLTNLSIMTQSVASSVTTSPGALIEAIDGERRKESSVGTAAAAGGLFLAGAGACALYARNRRSQPTELSRFGSPQRRTSSDMPRRFVPV